MFYLCFFFPKDSNIFCLIVDCEQITTLEKSGCCGNEFINVVINFFLKELVESISNNLNPGGDGSHWYLF